MRLLLRESHIGAARVYGVLAMVTEAIEIESSIETAPADVAQPRRRPAERQPPTTPQPPCLQAIHASKEGFILRGTHNDTFWEW